MVTMLMVAVPVVDVVSMPVVFDGFVPVTFGVYAFVVLVDHFFGVLLAVVDVVSVSFVFDGFVPITGKVLVVRGRMSIGHSCFPNHF